ncbi:MAG: RagB/SusD family nutrient uptake outer membrane protein [Bacteroidetes bacterium]|nr:RagB/SusD family nutrient uptake outer membrane protein [Bacteroidota bacterium]
MKKIKYFITAFSALLLLSSCGNDWLNEPIPDDSKSSNIPLTSKDVRSLEIALYDAVQSNLNYYNGQMIYSGDIMADDYQLRNGGGGKGEDFYLMDYAINSITGCWSPAYDLIKRSNVIIESEPSDYKDYKGVVDQIKGEAYFMRALSHFDILRQYGEFYQMDSKWGIPIIDRLIPGGELSTNKPGRNTVLEVYEIIISDLKESIILMDPTTSKKADGYVDVWAAKALLCRAYLYTGENAKCVAMAEDIITNSTYKLWTNSEYVEGWKERGGVEAIFEVKNTSDDGANTDSLTGFYNKHSSGGYGSFLATTYYANLFQEGDVRKTMFVTEEKLGALYLDKYPGVDKAATGDGNDYTTANYSILRLSEVYLNGAEAAQKIGDAKADTWLTAIAQRANPAAPAIVGANLERVLLERRLELGAEGFRFFDAIRNNKTMYRDNVAKYMEEINAAIPAVTIVQPGDATEINEEIHVELLDENKIINREHKRIILPIPDREMKVINPKIDGVEKINIEQYYKWL